MLLEIKNERIIKAIFEGMAESLSAAEEEVERLSGLENREKSMQIEIDALESEIKELKRDTECRTAEADKLQKTEARLSEVIEKNIIAWEKIRLLEARNTELEELQKKTAKAVSQADIDFLKKSNNELELRINELITKNLELERKLKKHNEAGEALAEVMGRRPGRPRKEVI